MTVYVIYQGDFPVAIKETKEECQKFIGCSIGSVSVYLTESHHKRFFDGICKTAIFMEEM